MVLFYGFYLTLV